MYCSVIEGNVYRPNNSGNNSTFATRDASAIIRNNVSVNAHIGFWKYSSGNNQSWHIIAVQESLYLYVV